LMKLSLLTCLNRLLLSAKPWDITIIPL